MVAFPRGLESGYSARLMRRLKALRSLVLDRMGPSPTVPEALDAVRRTQSVAAGAMAPEPRSFLSDARALEVAVTRDVARSLKAPVESVAWQKPQVDALLSQWAVTQAKLVAKLEADVLGDVGEHVGEADEGEDLRALVLARFAAYEARARLIARNELGNLQAQLVQLRAKGMGSNRYRWESRDDERVRPLHRALDGTVRSWDDPHPTEGHPGEALGCRCTAQPLRDAVALPGSVTRPALAAFGAPPKKAGAAKKPAKKAKAPEVPLPTERPGARPQITDYNFNLAAYRRAARLWWFGDGNGAVHPSLLLVHNSGEHALEKLAEIREALGRVPLDVQALLYERGSRMGVYGLISDWDPVVGHSQPGGWPDGMTFDALKGMALHQQAVLAVNPYGPPLREVALHELGHTASAYRSYEGIWKMWSQDSRYRADYRRFVDSGAIRRWCQETQRPYDYFALPGDKGPEEFWAEVFGAAYDPEQRAKIDEYFPGLLDTLALVLND